MYLVFTFDPGGVYVPCEGSDGQSHRTVSTNHNLFEEKGEPKRYRTEVLPLTNLTPYREAKPAHISLPFSNLLLTRVLNDGAVSSALRCVSTAVQPSVK